MILASIYQNQRINTCIFTDGSFIKVPYSNNIFEILNNEELPVLKKWYEEKKSDPILKDDVKLNESQIRFAPLYKSPRKIWGIGLNYEDHAKDLDEKSPAEIPASFLKPSTTIIGYKDPIMIPTMSKKTTGEAELGIIIGKKCKNINRKDWLDYVAGFTTIIDMTAEDILRKNPRYLTLSKSFDTFFSFGPCLYTPDEISNIENLKVATVINGHIWAENYVKNMTFPPDFLVEFHSQVMTLLPGDIISTGTPKATPLAHNDIIECRITGFKSLKNPVVDLKLL
jgi:2-keto-4-pentenoate hydratase/2-oxohepta-3-ene-1,7-dioic acid hydratase in catechol pathway